MKNILVPTDFSDVANNALKFAIKIAHALKARVVLMHAVPPILVANDMGGFVYPDNLDNETNTVVNIKMDKLLESVEAQHVAVSKIIHKGILEETIEGVIEKEKIDLIVTGTHGAKGLDTFFFGTNSVHIFEKVSCPVLIVPKDAKYHSIKKIMYATDFQYGDIHEIERICEIAKPFNAQVIVTHVNSDSDKFIENEETMDWFAEIGDSSISYKNIVYKLIYSKEVVEALEKTATVQQADILCMSTVEKDFFKKLVSKSNTKEMAFHTRIPLMTLHLGKSNKLK